MSRMRFKFVMLAGLLLSALSACALQGDPAAAVQAYLQARVESRAADLINLSCKDWEAQAVTEATSFESMDAQLQDVACQSSGADGGYTLVNCEGKIVTTYRGENREWNLADNTFRAVLEDGEWRMCGYAGQ